MSSQRELFFRHVAQTSDFPMALEISHGSGNYLVDVNGKKYIDFISGISVSNLGHNHPKIVAAIKNQVNKNLHTMVYGEYINAPQVQLASELAKHLPVNLNSVYFVNSGSEAVEGAMKLAKRFTGRKKIISFLHSYHGSTQGALSLGGNENMRNAFEPLLDGMIRMRYNCFEDLDNIDSTIAAVFVEPIQAEAGVILPEIGYLQKLRECCSRYNVLLIFDEIQTGYGRLGKLFAIDEFSIIPDVLLLAKGFGGGMPLGAFISSKEIMNSFTNNPVLGHISTFGGNPVCCAASLAMLREITQTNLLSELRNKSELIRSRINSNNIMAIRNKGLMFAVQLKNFETVQRTIQTALNKGLIVDWFLYNNSAIRLAPPLTITEIEIEKAIQILNESLNS